MKINREILKNINLSQKDELLGYILILEKQERLNNQEPVSAYLQEDDWKLLLFDYQYRH